MVSSSVISSSDPETGSRPLFPNKGLGVSGNFPLFWLVPAFEAGTFTVGSFSTSVLFVVSAISVASAVRAIFCRSCPTGTDAGNFFCCSCGSFSRRGRFGAIRNARRRFT